MNNLQYFLKKNSQFILTCVGAIGVVATSVLAVQATPKALTLIEDAKKEKKDSLTKIEMIQVAWKPYIPAIISGASTIICIFGANYLNTKAQASLISAYALLDNSYKEYKNKVIKHSGKNFDKNIQFEIMEDHIEDYELKDNEAIFFDFNSLRSFVSTMDKVLEAENRFLESFKAKGYGCLNEYYDYLGIPFVDYGFDLGWFDIENNDPYNCHELEFIYEKFDCKGHECWVISTNNPPALDYIL